MPTTLASPCRRTTLALPWLVNGTLPPEERREVRDHLIRCAGCRAELARTREVLAMFRAVPGAETEQPLGAVAGSARFGGRAESVQKTVRKVLRPLSWAAMIAALVAAVGGTWLVGMRSAGPAATSHAGRPTPAAPPIEAAVSAPAPTVSPSPPPQVAEVSQPRPSPAARPSRRAAAPAPAPVRSEVISITSFDSGTIAPLANGSIQISPSSSRISSRISTADFENGQLGWQ